MKVLNRLLGTALILGLACGDVIRTIPKKNLDVKYSLYPHPSGGFELFAGKDGDQKYFGHVGRTLAEGNDIFEGTERVNINSGDTSFGFSAQYDDAAKAWWLRISWVGPPERKLVDCFNFGSKQWYGGPEQKKQYWPIQNGGLEHYSIISKEDDNAAVSERYWLNSAGQYFYVHPNVPLFVDYHNHKNNHLCFISEVAAPYSSKRTHNELTYDIWFFDNPKDAHLHAVNTYLGKPSGVPDYRMIQHPVWSTWARYSRDINEDNLWEFANEIAKSGFGNSQFEIDDLWEICYGSLTVDERKFPDFAQFVRDVKSLGFRVSIWVHPFINNNCDPWYTEALSKGYFVLNEEGSPDTSWWNSNGSISAYIDFTNSEAAEWWAGRVRSVLDTYDIDSAKFDAGESSWSPQIPVQNGDIYTHPGHIVESFLRTVSQFGSAIEVRSGMRTQDLPIFVRMVDKDTVWDLNNGLATLVTTLLQMNMNGYTLVLPDMIGGNGYVDDGLVYRQFPEKELFLRWLQTNTFMPALQFSFVPWDLDDETVEISRFYTELHAQFADEIVAAIEASVTVGTPVNPPIWWIDPTDEEALAVSDEFLLGEKILVAPVIEEGATTRNIYLPQGKWFAYGRSNEVYQGPNWLRDYPAPLDTLPYFVKQD